MSLDAALRTALQNNPSLKAAESEVAAAAAVRRGARARQQPVVSLNGFAAKSTNGTILSGPPRSDPAALMAIPTGSPFLVANVMAMVPLFTGGYLEGLAGAASAEEQAARGEADEMRGMVEMQVAEAYFMALRAAETVTAQQAKLTANEEMVRITQAQLEAGKGIEASVRRVQAELEMARRELANAQNEREKALLDLKAAMGVDLDSPLELSTSLALSEAPKDLDALLAMAERARGRLVAARARERAAGQQTKSAEAGLHPQVYGIAMGDLTNRDMMSGSTLGVVLSIPITNSMQRSEIDEKRSMRARAMAQRREAELIVTKEVRQAWLDLQTSEANARSAQSAVTAAQSSYDVMALRVSSGKGILLEQLDALQTLTRARAELAEAIADHETAIVRLRRAAGQNLQVEVKP